MVQWWEVRTDRERSDGPPAPEVFEHRVLLPTRLLDPAGITAMWHKTMMGTGEQRTIVRDRDRTHEMGGVQWEPNRREGENGRNEGGREWTRRG